MNARCLFLVFAGLALTVSAAEKSDWFAQGVAAGQSGRLVAASQAFEKSIRQHPSAGALLNLGIVQWQRGQPGPAIQSWEQARWLDWSNRRADQNLRFARQVLGVDAPQLDWYETASTWLPVNAWVWMAGISLWLAVGLVILPGVLRRPKAGWQHGLAALALGVFLCSLAANIGVVTRTRIGFLLPKNTPLRLTPTTAAETMAVLSAGEPARRLRTHGNFIYIRTAEGSGWVEKDQFGPICPE